MFESLQYDKRYKHLIVHSLASSISGADLRNYFKKFGEVVLSEVRVSVCLCVCVCVCVCLCLCLCRAAERIGANAKSGATQNGLCEGGLGACPQEILRFYML